MSIHDTLREALNDAIVEPTIDIDAVTDQILGRLGGNPGGDGGPPEGGGDGGGGAGAGGGGAGNGFAAVFGALPLWATTSGGAAIGLLVALAITNPFASDTASPPAAVTEFLESVPTFACPGEGRAGTLHRGDRVYIVGQAPGYAAVRNVRGDGSTVYVAAEHVTPDSDISSLPFMDCEHSGTVTALEPSVAPSEPTLPASEPEPAPDEPAPKPAPAPAPEPAPVDTAQPVFGNVYGSPETVGQVGSTCTPQSSTITANVTDNMSVTSVTARWTLPSGTVSKTMAASGSNNYTVTFSVPANTYTLNPYSASVPVEVTAKDAAGNTTTNNDLTMTVTWGCLI